MNRYVKPLMGVVASAFFWVGAAQAAENMCNLAQVQPESPAATQGGGWQTPQANAPSVQLAETMFDFGQLKEDGDYLHVFKVKNAGAATLQIKKVLPG